MVEMQHVRRWTFEEYVRSQHNDPLAKMCCRREECWCFVESRVMVAMPMSEPNQSIGRQTRPGCGCCSECECECECECEEFESSICDFICVSK